LVVQNADFFADRPAIYLHVTLCGTSVPVSQLGLSIKFTNSSDLDFGSDGAGNGGAQIMVGQITGSTFTTFATLNSGPPVTANAGISWSVPLSAPAGATDITISFAPDRPWSGTISIGYITITQ